MSAAGHGGPVLSVLVPAWNVEGSIATAVRSVLETSDVSLECLIIDDGSTDGTVAVARALAAQDERVTVLALEANGGVSNARNRGLAIARGDWLTFLDADDRFVPGGLATLAQAALGSDALAVIGQQVWTDGKRLWRTAFYDVPDIREPGRKSLAGSPGLLNYLSPHAKLFHRSTWTGLTFSGRVLGDQPWVTRALLRAGDRIDVLGETVYEWYRPRRSRGVASITSTTRSRVASGIEAIEVATAALTSVREEALARLPPADAQRLAQAYAARLLAMDLAAHVTAALGRRDPEIALLFDAIRDFVVGVAPGDLGATDTLARTIIEPPLGRWWRIPPEGRAAFWRLVVVASEVDPRLAAHGSNRLARTGLRLAVRAGDGATLASSTAQAGAIAILTAGRIPGFVRGLVVSAFRRGPWRTLIRR